MTISFSKNEVAIFYFGIIAALAGSILSNLVVVYLMKIMDLLPNANSPLMIIIIFIIVVAAFLILILRLFSKIEELTKIE